MDFGPRFVVEPFGTHQQQFANVIERIVGPTSMMQCGLLDALTALDDRLIREAHDMKRVDHDHHVTDQFGRCFDG